MPTDIHDIIVQSRSPIIQVVKLSLDLVDSCAGELHQREHKGHIICNSEEGAFLVLQVFGVDLIDQLSSEGAELTEFLEDITIMLPFLLFIGVFDGKSLPCSLRLQEPVKVGVDDARLLALVDPVEDLQHVPADELIVAVECEDDGVLSAVVDRGQVDVLEGSGAPRVFDVGVELLVDGVEAEEAAVEWVAIVGGSIVHNNHPVVGVVLREDGVEVVLDAEVGVVVETGHHDAHWQLLPYPRQRKLGFEP